MTDSLDREVRLALWKVHILHHAGEAPIYGQWLITELGRHGFGVSPGTLYPLLARMERHGWLRVQRARGAGTSPKARRSYVLTADGRRALQKLRAQVAELHEEIASAPSKGRRDTSDRSRRS